MECEIVANANILLQKFSSERANYRPREGRWMYNWLTSTAYSKLEQTGGPEFIAWLSEYVPTYKLQIDAEKLGNVKFEGWKKTETNTWEVFLTHSQMVIPCSLHFFFSHHIRANKLYVIQQILHQKVFYKDNLDSLFAFRHYLVMSCSNRHHLIIGVDVVFVFVDNYQEVHPSMHLINSYFTVLCFALLI